VAVLTRLRTGLVVFRRPRLAVVAVASQFIAWGIQWSLVYVLLIGLHLDPPAGLAAAAAVLFAINVTMLLPVTPGDLGVFQAAVAFVLHAGWGVAYSRGVAYGVVLQAAELAAALIMGVPALVHEGGSWRRLDEQPPGFDRNRPPVRRGPAQSISDR
jgi:phosphatidylinositol alpha-mannosyltransferase